MGSTFIVLIIGISIVLLSFLFHFLPGVFDVGPLDIFGFALAALFFSIAMILEEAMPSYKKIMKRIKSIISIIFFFFAVSSIMVLPYIKTNETYIKINETYIKTNENYVKINDIYVKTTDNFAKYNDLLTMISCGIVISSLALRDIIKEIKKRNQTKETDKDD